MPTDAALTEDADMAPTKAVPAGRCKKEAGNAQSISAGVATKKTGRLRILWPSGERKPYGTAPVPPKLNTREAAQDDSKDRICGPLLLQEPTVRPAGRP